MSTKEYYTSLKKEYGDTELVSIVAKDFENYCIKNKLMESDSNEN